MNSRTVSILAMVGFILLGSACLALRYHSRQEAQTARQDERWELTYQVEFESSIPQGQQGEAAITFGMPLDTPYCRVLKREWIIPNPNLRWREVGPTKGRRNLLLELITRQSEKYRASMKFLLLLSPRAGRERQMPLESLTSDTRSMFTDREENLPVGETAVTERLNTLTAEAESDADVLQRIFEYCTQIDSSAESAQDTVSSVLSTRTGTPLARARTMVTLCRTQKIPARLVTGFRIAQGTNVQPHVWVEVFQNQTWVPFDPTDGWSLSLPMNYVPVRRGSDQVWAISRNMLPSVTATYSIRVLERDRSVLQSDLRHPIQILNLERLPVPMHKVMKILLLLPFAALITTMLRNVVGLGTFGTFSPALLAMSFIYADLTTGIAILAIVIAVGLVGRTFLEKLRLLMVPRLSIILTMVILCVVFGISILHYLLPNISAEVVLLPMVILTMLIERFHVSAEEDGMIFTIQLAAGTLLVAILCYLVLRWDEVGSLVLTYPEIHFYTIAAFIFLGRYAGYRLTELWRFSDLVDSGEAGR